MLHCSSPSLPKCRGDERKGWEAEGINLKSTPFRGSQRAVNEFFHQRANTHSPHPSHHSLVGSLKSRVRLPSRPGSSLSGSPSIRSLSCSSPSPSFLEGPIPGGRSPLDNLFSAESEWGEALGGPASGPGFVLFGERLFCRVEGAEGRAFIKAGEAQEETVGERWVPQGAGLVKRAQWIFLGCVTPSLPPGNRQ